VSCQPIFLRGLQTLATYNVSVSCSQGYLDRLACVSGRSFPSAEAHGRDFGAGVEGEELCRHGLLTKTTGPSDVPVSLHRMDGEA
jgi:hypothetical protein